MSHLSHRSLLVGAGAAVALTAASVGAVAAAQPASSRHGWPGAEMTGTRATSSCSAPSSLPGQRVTVMLGDMGAGMMGGYRGGMMGGYPGGMMRGGSTAATGWMMVHAVPQTVRAGTVSLVAYNHGTRTHELVVLPLATGAAVGTRAVGTDNAVDEAGSLGEASKDCAFGGGDGITAGAASWVTLTLQPGRYELVCNLPGHYAAGMYTELDVT